MRRSGNKVFNTVAEAMACIEEYVLNGSEITAIEFSLCSDILKQKYLEKTLALNLSSSYDRSLPFWLFDWCSIEKKLEIINLYISNQKKLSRDMIKVCPPELVEQYIDYRIKEGNLHSFETEFLNERQVREYLNAKVDSGNFVSGKI